mmetsp:Transcript_22292/g.84568  ORF Transcript_22292/g.84568 Transcript_22292/m.84568 type:complete len:326 (-) Transcript_22292:300-1277(-)
MNLVLCSEQVATPHDQGPAKITLEAAALHSAQRVGRVAPHSNTAHDTPVAAAQQHEPQRCRGPRAPWSRQSMVAMDRGRLLGGLCRRGPCLARCHGQTPSGLLPSVPAARVGRCAVRPRGHWLPVRVFAGVVVGVEGLNCANALHEGLSHPALLESHVLVACWSSGGSGILAVASERGSGFSRVRRRRPPHRLALRVRLVQAARAASDHASALEVPGLILGSSHGLVTWLREPDPVALRGLVSRVNLPPPRQRGLDRRLRRWREASHRAVFHDWLALLSKVPVQVLRQVGKLPVCRALTVNTLRTTVLSPLRRPKCLIHPAAPGC